MRGAWGLVIVGVVVTSACSGGGSSTATTAPTTTTATTATTDTTATTATTTTTATSTTATTIAAAAATTTTVVTAESLAAALDVAERGIRDTSLDDAARAAHGRAQQAAYRAAGNDRALLESLPGLVADDVRDAVALNVAARVAVLDHAERRAAEGRATPPPPTLPAWTIVEPRPIDELLGYYREAEALTDVPWPYLAAINLVETRMGRIVGASEAGAVGPMQFLPETWAACCTGDPTDPHDAIVGAATYLAQQGAPGDMVRALTAYNPNQGYVGSVIAYAANLAADERAYVGYHAWEVYVSTSVGSIRLPVGYSADAPIDAATYVAEHPAG